MNVPKLYINLDEKYDIRMEIYETFVRLLTLFYKENNGDVKEEEK